MSLVLHKKDLGKLLIKIADSLPTYGPMEDKEGAKTRFRFGRIKKAKDYVMLYGPTVIPPKKYLFPAREDVMKFEKGEILPPINKDFVVFGVNKKDAEGIFYLDEIYRLPYPDEHYIERRKHMKLIIVDSLPPSNNVSCDLYLQLIDGEHLSAFPFTEYGESLVAGNPLFGREGDVGAISVQHMPDDVLFHPRLAEIVEKSRNNKIWDGLAEICFNCGVCSYVCPLCYCYEQEDRVDVTSNVKKDIKGARERRWDSCMLPDFAALPFKDFRATHRDRIYNWYFHKFVRMPSEYGFPGCVDCGRCIVYCPARINYRKVLKSLIDNEKRK